MPKDENSISKKYPNKNIWIEKAHLNMSTEVLIIFMTIMADI